MRPNQSTVAELFSTTRRIKVDTTTATATLLDEPCAAPRLRESSDEDFQRRVGSVGNILCPLGHPIELSEPPLQCVQLYFREDELEVLADLPIAAADAAAAATGHELDDAGSAFTHATVGLMICPTCG